MTHYAMYWISEYCETATQQLCQQHSTQQYTLVTHWRVSLPTAVAHYLTQRLNTISFICSSTHNYCMDKTHQCTSQRNCMQHRCLAPYSTKLNIHYTTALHIHYTTALNTPLHNGTRHPLHDGTSHPLHDGTQHPLHDGTPHPTTRRNCTPHYTTALHTELHEACSYLLILCMDMTSEPQRHRNRTIIISPQLLQCSLINYIK